MMKIKMLLSVFLCFTYLFMPAQKREYSDYCVIDDKTGESIIGCNIIIKSRGLGTITDIKGFFNIDAIVNNPADTIIISHLLYEDFIISVKELDKVIRLKSKHYVIEEVQVTGNKLNIKSVLKEVIRKYNSRDKSKPHIAIAHYREKALSDNQYIMFSESVGYSIYCGLVKNASRLSNYKFVCEDSRSHITNDKWKRLSDNHNDRTQHVPLGSGMNLNALRTLEEYGILGGKNLKKFHFDLDSSFIENGCEYLVLNFRNMNFNGRLILNYDWQEIVKINYHTNSYYSAPFNTRLDADVEINFTYYDNQAYITSISSSYCKDGISHINDLNILIQKFSDFRLTIDEYWKINEYDNNTYIVYTPEKWDKFSIPIEQEYEKICKNLGFTEKEMEVEFIKFSGHWLRKTKEKDYEWILDVFKSFKTHF